MSFGEREKSLFRGHFLGNGRHRENSATCEERLVLEEGSLDLSLTGINSKDLAPWPREVER